nr:hypothetical protein CFP56_67725 [Quercus suber]
MDSPQVMVGLHNSASPPGTLIYKPNFVPFLDMISWQQKSKLSSVGISDTIILREKVLDLRAAWISYRTQKRPWENLFHLDTLDVLETSEGLLLIESSYRSCGHCAESRLVQGCH